MSDKWATLSHDDLRDHIVQNYRKLPPLECRFCGQLATFPVGDTVIPEHNYAINGTRSRADIAVLDVDQRLIAVLEVIYSHPPRNAVLDAHKHLEAEVFYLDKNSAVGPDQLTGWCNPACWEWDRWFQAKPKFDESHSQRFRESLLEFCGRCDYIFTASQPTFRDWADDPSTAFCFTCAAGIYGAQWAAPGTMIRGMEDPSIDKVGWTDDPVSIFHFLPRRSSGPMSGVAGSLGCTQATNQEIATKRLPIIGCRWSLRPSLVDIGELAGTCCAA